MAQNGHAGLVWLDLMLHRAAAQPPVVKKDETRKGKEGRKEDLEEKDPEVSSSIVTFDTTVGTLGDVTLALRDVALAAPQQWLNDNLIAFYFEHLDIELRRVSTQKNGEDDMQALPTDATPVASSYWERIVDEMRASKGDETSSESVHSVANISTGRKRVLFVHPGSIFMSQFVDSEHLAQILGTLATDLAACDLIFLPVNDHADAQSAGGSHWSVLVFVRGNTNEADGKNAAEHQLHRLLHFDSLGYNLDVARAVAPKFLPLILPYSNRDVFPKVEDGHSARQNNGCDCGVYVLANTRQFCASWLAGVPFDPSSITPDVVLGVRNEICEQALLLFRSSSLG